MATMDNAKATSLETGGDNLGSQVRRRSVTAVEIVDKGGRRKTVQLAELNSADRALAEQFGYKPVG